jgi:O-antigen/teichoic acid export membrane protein
MKKLLISLVEKIHLMIFGHEISDQMRGFLNNLSWSFYGGVIAMPVSMVVGTLAGRFMGPAEYGSYNLVILISSYVTVFSFLGLDISIIRNVAKAKNHYDQEKSFFSSVVFVGSMTILYSLIGLIFRQKIAGVFGINKMIILFVVIYTLIVSFKLIQDILVRALEKFKLQAIARTIEVLTLVLGFVLVMATRKGLDFGLYMGVVLLAAALVGIIYFVNLKGYFRNFSLSTLRRQLSEGKFFMLSGLLGTVFLSADRLLIAKYIGLTTLGVYSAYYAASLGLVTAMSLILTNVLFPVSAKSDDKSFTKKIDLLFTKGLLPIFLMICLAILVFLSIFGKAYPLKLDYVLLFALVATLYFFLIVYNVVILDAGRKRYTQYFYAMSSVNLLTVGYYFFILKYVSQSIEVVLMGFAVNLIINLSVQRVFVRKMRKEQYLDIHGTNSLNSI